MTGRSANASAPIEQHINCHERAGASYAGTEKDETAFQSVKNSLRDRQVNQCTCSERGWANRLRRALDPAEDNVWDRSDERIMMLRSITQDRACGTSHAMTVNLKP